MAMGETAATVKAYVAQHRLSFLHLLDADHQAASLFSIRATPTTLLTDRSGHILGGGAGYRDWSTPAAHQLVQSLLKDSADGEPGRR